MFHEGFATLSHNAKLTSSLSMPAPAPHSDPYSVPQCEAHVVTQHASSCVALGSTPGAALGPTLRSALDPALGSTRGSAFGSTLGPALGSTTRSSRRHSACQLLNRDRSCPCRPLWRQKPNRTRPQKRDSASTCCRFRFWRQTCSYTPSLSMPAPAVYPGPHSGPRSLARSDPYSEPQSIPHSIPHSVPHSVPQFGAHVITQHGLSVP